MPFKLNGKNMKIPMKWTQLTSTFFFVALSVGSVSQAGRGLGLLDCEKKGKYITLVRNFDLYFNT